MTKIHKKPITITNPEYNQNCSINLAKSDIYYIDILCKHKLSRFASRSDFVRAAVTLMIDYEAGRMIDIHEKIKQMLQDNQLLEHDEKDEKIDGIYETANSRGKIFTFEEHVDEDGLTWLKKIRR